MKALYLAFITALVLALGLPALAFADGSSASTTLYTADFDSGALTEVGEIGDGESVVGLAISTTEQTTYALTTGGELIEFSSDDPGTITSRQTVSGLNSDDMLVGIDVRPATGDLFALGANSQVYTLDTDTGEATAVGDGFSPALEGTAFGFDFNPTVDRIRVVSDTGQNLRLNPETGEVGTDMMTGDPTIDGDLTYADGDENQGETPSVVAAGYTNNAAGATETELYVIDADADVLATQAPPNDGVLNTDGDLGIDVGSLVGFDISPNGTAFVAVTFGSPDMPDTGGGAASAANHLAVLAIASLAFVAGATALARVRTA